MELIVKICVGECVVWCVGVCGYMCGFVCVCVCIPQSLHIALCVTNQIFGLLLVLMDYLSVLCMERNGV